MTEASKPTLMDVLEVLAPFAALAEVCDHFHKDNVSPICSWRIDGHRRLGPTVGDVRKARDVLLAATEDMAPSEVRIRHIDDIIVEALRAEARLLLASCTEAQALLFHKAHLGGIDIMDRARLADAIAWLQRRVALNAKVDRAGAA